MRIALHILIRPDDSFAAKVVAAQQQNTTGEIRIIDLTRGEVDYKKLLENVFEADSVSVW